MIDFRLQQYIEWKVGKVIPIKGKFGFRVTLYYLDLPKKVQQKSGFTTEREANVARDQTVGELYAGDYIVYENILVKEFLEFWLDMEYRRVGKPVHTYLSFRSIIRNKIIPYLGTKKIADINSRHIQALYQTVALSSKVMAYHTRTVMGLAMKYAKAKKFIARNPAVGVVIPKTENSKEYHTRSINSAKTLNLEQIMILIQASRQTPIYIAILFNILMGLRRGEIVGLKYSDVDYVNQELHVQRQIGKAFVEKEGEDKPIILDAQEIPLKTSSSYRVLLIPDYVFDAIIKERERYEERKKEAGEQFHDFGFIFCSETGAARNKNFHYQYYKRILRENGLPDIRWHDLRSSYCTLLLKNEFNPKAVSNLMGHAKEIITIDVYGDNKVMAVDCTREIDMFINELHLKQIEMPMAEDKFFDSVCINPEDL